MKEKNYIKIRDQYFIPVPQELSLYSHICSSKNLLMNKDVINISSKFKGKIREKILVIELIGHLDQLIV